MFKLVWIVVIFTIIIIDPDSEIVGDLSPNPAGLVDAIRCTRLCVSVSVCARAQLL